MLGILLHELLIAVCRTVLHGLFIALALKMLDIKNAGVEEGERGGSKAGGGGALSGCGHVQNTSDDFTTLLGMLLHL